MQLPEHLERLAKQDEREDLELLARGVRDRPRQPEDEPCHLVGEEEVERDLDRIEVAGRREARQRRGQELPPPELESDERGCEHDAERGRDEPAGRGALPLCLEAIEQGGQHGGPATAGARILP